MGAAKKKFAIHERASNAAIFNNLDELKVQAEEIVKRLESKMTVDAVLQKQVDDKMDELDEAFQNFRDDLLIVKYERAL